MAKLQAISLDMGSAFKKATTEKAPNVRRCVDRFHLVVPANVAINQARRWAWNEQHRVLSKRSPGRPRRDESRPHDQACWMKHTRWALLKDPANLSDEQLAVLHELRRSNSALYRNWQLTEAQRDLYRLHNPADAPGHLEWWLLRANRLRIPERIWAAIVLNLSNSQLEELNSKIHLINHRGCGHHSAEAIIAVIYLCHAALTTELPTSSLAG